MRIKNTKCCNVCRNIKLEVWVMLPVVLHHGNRRDLIKNNTTITDNADHVLALKPLKGICFLDVE